VTLTIENILQEADLTEYSGEVLFKHEPFLNSFSRNKDFLLILEIELKKSIANKNLNRFCFICHMLIAFGQDKEEYRTIYSSIIYFVNKEFENRSAMENEQLLTIVLDLLWHQNKGLKGLSDNQQISLSLLLKNSAKHKYELDQNGDEIFFAIKKAIDLIKFQKNTVDITELYLNHFDEKIKQEAIEMKRKNWL
jgi:hypothetical protein